MRYWRSERLTWWANCLGITGAPFDSYMTLRGVRTLHARMRQHQESAGRIAEVLAQHRQVRRVYYPGLPDHPGHEIAARQQHGYGGMVSFEIEGGLESVQAFVEHLEFFSLAESLRLSIGLEDTADLVGDIVSALEAGSRASRPKPVAAIV